MSEKFLQWLSNLRHARQSWVDASRLNKFDRGIWNATVAKYADPAHFVLELLQNAEDAGATRATFRLEADAIEFEHDGKPFDRDDIEGVTGIGNTTKLDQPRKIGCFGIGFKSVHVVTNRPEVHCTIEGQRTAFAIRDLVVPDIIDPPISGDKTVIRLPLNPENSDDVLRQVQTALTAGGPRSLLFLDSVRELRWSGPQMSGSCLIEDDSDVRTLRIKQDGEALPSERYVILTRSVARPDDVREYTVKVALTLNAGGEIVPETSPTKLSVFFETEDSTGLRFRAHGPFQLTDNRANAKREDPWNATLISELAALMAECLPALRDKGFLNRSFLEVLPNSGDVLEDGWEIVRDQLVKAFQTTALIPAHEGGHVSAKHAVRGPADIRDVFGDDGIAVFADKPRHRWTLAGLRGRADTFIATVGVPEFGYSEALAAFSRALQPSYFRTAKSAAVVWFETLADERLQKLYLVVDAATKSVRRPGFAHLAFVRLEDGRAVEPDKARLAPKASVEDIEATSSSIGLVRSSLVRSGRGRGPDVEQFLRRCGVKDVSESDFLRKIVAEGYNQNGSGPTAEQHLRHIRRLIAHHSETGDDAFLRGVAFLRVDGPEGYFAPESVFLGEPFARTGLAHIYGERVPGRKRKPLWQGYAKLSKQKEFRAMVVSAGAEDRLLVESVSPRSNAKWSSLYNGFGGSRITGTGVSDDYTIPQLAGLLSLRDVEVSKLIWAAVTAAGPHVMWARWSPNQSWNPNTAPSQLAATLSEAEWIPDKHGSFHRPRAMSAPDLPAGFPIQSADKWLQVVGFGGDQRERSEQGQARRKAAESIGLTAIFADRLQGLTPESRAALETEMIKRIEDGSFARPQFPEREAFNPERREARVTERAKAAPAKTVESRQRSVRTSDVDVRAQARTFLRDQYTNEDGQMVCQACYGEMPFRVPGGDYYFEAVSLVRSPAVELVEDFIAMCPTCAAKWQHARETDDDAIVASVAANDEPRVEIKLAGEAEILRFTSMHFADLRAAFHEVMG